MRLHSRVSLQILLLASLIGGLYIPNDILSYSVSVLALTASVINAVFLFRCVFHSFVVHINFNKVRRHYKKQSQCTVPKAYKISEMGVVLSVSIIEESLIEKLLILVRNTSSQTLVVSASGLGLEDYFRQKIEPNQEVEFKSSESKGCSVKFIYIRDY